MFMYLPGKKVLLMKERWSCEASDLGRTLRKFVVDMASSCSWTVSRITSVVQSIIHDVIIIPDQIKHLLCTATSSCSSFAPPQNPSFSMQMSANRQIHL